MQMRRTRERTDNTVPTLERGNEDPLQGEGIVPPCSPASSVPFSPPGRCWRSPFSWPSRNLRGTKPRGPTSGVVRQFGAEPFVSRAAGAGDCRHGRPRLAGVVGDQRLFGGLGRRIGRHARLSAVSSTTSKQPFARAEFMVWVQLMTIAAAVWAIGWLVVRRWRNIWTMKSRGMQVACDEAKHATHDEIGMPPIARKLSFDDAHERPNRIRRVGQYVVARHRSVGNYSRSYDIVLPFRRAGRDAARMVRLGLDRGGGRLSGGAARPEIQPQRRGTDRHERFGFTGLHRAEFAHAGRRRRWMAMRLIAC